MKESWVFGSLISATDPVAVLSIFKEMDADENLYSIVFGESIFNDAIGIVMFQTVLKMGKSDDKSSGEEVLTAVGRFVTIFLGSLILGAMLGLIAAFILKRQAQYLSSEKIDESGADEPKNLRQMNFEDSQNGNTQISLILMCPWICYLIADGLELSGIVAILTNGIVLNYYATPNISNASSKVIKIAVDTVAYVTETMVFLFLGIGFVAFEHPYKEMGFGTILMALVNLNLARLINIGIVTFFVNKSRTEDSKYTFKHQFVMWIAGLRGAMAYALALESTNELKLAGQVMLLVTLIYALFTILGVSSFLYPIMVKCEVT